MHVKSPGKLDELHTFLSCHVFDFLKSLVGGGLQKLGLLTVLSLSLKYSLILESIYTQVKTTEVLK